MQENQATLIPGIDRLLNQIRRKQKRVWSFSAVLTAVSTVVLLWWSILTIEAIYWIDPPQRMILPGILLAGDFLILLILTVYLSWIWIRSSWPSSDSFARKIWRQDSKIRDHVLSALKFSTVKDTRGSAELREAAIRIYDQEAKNLSASSYVNHKPLKLAAKISPFVILLPLVIVLIFHKAYFSAYERIAFPGEHFAKPGEVYLKLEIPRQVQVVQGESLLLSARAWNQIPTEIDFILSEGGGLQRNKVATRDSSDTTLFQVTIQNIERGFSVYAKSDHSNSDSSVVQVVPRPRLSRVNVTVKPPSYTKLGDEALPEGVGDVSALPGSRAMVELEASLPLLEGKLVYQPRGGKEQIQPLSILKRRATGSFALSSEGRWWVELVSADSVASDEPLVWLAGLKEDYPPRIEIRLPENDSEIPETRVVPLVIVADDDFGISKLQLRFYIYNELLSPDTLDDSWFMAMPLKGEVVEQGRTIVQQLWSLRELPLLPTEEIHYFAEAWDNDPYGGPKHVRSEVRRLIFPSLDDLFEQVNEDENSIVEDIREAAEKAKDAREQVQKTIEQLRSNPNELSWQEMQAVQKTLADQQKMLEQLDKASETLEQMKSEMQKHDMVSKELMDKYDRLQDLLKEVATPEMRQAMEKLQEAIEAQDLEKLREAMENFAMDQEEMLKSIDRSLSILEQLKKERRMDELAKRAQDLAERQQNLSEKLDKADPNEMKDLANEQNQLKNDLESFKEQLDQFQEELAEDSTGFSDSLGNVSDQLDSLKTAETMQQASANMSQGQKPPAQMNAQKAAQQLASMSKQMQNLQQQLQQQNKDELSKEMDRIFEQLLVLSRRQELLAEQSNSLGISSPRYRDLATQQDALKQGLHRSMEAVSELSKKTFFVGAKLMNDLVIADEQMTAAIDRYTARRAKDVASQQKGAMASIHRALKNLSDAAEQMQNSESGTGYDEMMEQLQKMAGQQQSLNQASQGMPMPMPGGGAPGPSPSLSQIAAQQRALAQAMGSLEQQGKGMQELMGSLDGLADSMNEVAKDLDDKNITNRTRKLQKRILQRLLDSQRSMQKRELSRKRESNTGKDLFRVSPGDLLPGEEDLLRARMLRALKSDYSDQWKPVIREYFKALERDGK